ncbi:MAG TPA: hypothetical protein VGK64_01550 [Bryobacteraceae bacterium]
MPGRGPQTFKKRQKEQQRKERQQEKMEKRLRRKAEAAANAANPHSGDSDVEATTVGPPAAESDEDALTGEARQAGHGA